MARIAVAGAGIGGLAAAIALARAGHSVAVFERSPAPTEAGAGLQLSPNAAAVLRNLGLLDAVRREAVAPAELVIRRGRDGRDIARLPFGAAAEARYGAPFLVTRRADLHDVLLSEARRLPLALRFGTPVEGWTARGAGLTVRLGGAADGEAAEADGLVGADGIFSAVRGRLRGIGPDDVRLSGRTAWRATIDVRHVPDGFAEPRSNLWLGPGAHLVHYPVAGGRQVNVVAITTDAGPDAGAARFWSAPGDPAALARGFRGWWEPARRLLAAAADWRVWPLLDRPPLARWSQGPVTLLGDAAHPMLPFLAQGAAQAIEDAALLAEAAARHPGDIVAAFAVYERGRRPRTARVQTASRRQGAVYHLGFPASAARDLAMRARPAAKLLARYDWLYGYRA